MRSRTPNKLITGCSRCGETDSAKFYGTSAWCKECHKDAVYRGRLAKVGLTPEDREALSAAQGGCCAACKRSEVLFGRNLHMDHDHSTGAARGLLCGRCNQVLGRCEDDATLLRALADYLDRQPDRV